MISDQPPPSAQEDILLRAFKTHVKRSLRDKLIPVATAVVEEAIVEAMEALRVGITAARQDLENKLVVNLTIDGVQKK